VAVTAFQPAAAIYREEQNFAWWVYALLFGVELVFWLVLAVVFEKAPNHGAAPFFGSLLDTFGWLSVLVVLASPALLLVALLRMTTEVTPSQARVWFGWIPTYRRVVPITSIQRLEVVRYRPLVDYGGWGIRTGRDGERALNARGDRGVRLYFSDGSRLLIGSQRPESLALAIEGAMRPSI
jgi:hypothetical protein